MFKPPFGPAFPTRFGVPAGGAAERQMLDAIGGSEGFRTRFRTNPGGSVTRLDTKNGMPRFTTTAVASATRVAILSGITRGGTLVGAALHDFKPTAQAREFANVTTLPIVFNDEPKLKVNLAPRLTGPEDGQPAAGEYDYIGTEPPDLQYRHITGSMYSGKMAKLVQLIMAYGRTPSNDQPQAAAGTPYQVGLGYTKEGLGGADLTEAQAVTQVLYDYRWRRCHGVVTAADGKLWLVEISVVNGVIAMPLPMQTTNTYTGNAQDVLREAGTLFGGLPSGGTFPADEDMADAITAGTVIVLATPAEMADFFDKTPYSSALGWSFNEAGTEAHNTCWYFHPTDVTPVFGTPKRMACHYKLAIDIGESSGTATLELVEEAWMVLRRVAPGSPDGMAVPFVFHEPEQEPDYSDIGDRPVVLADGDQGTTTADGDGFPVFVCHRDGELEIVRVTWLNDTGPFTAGPRVTAFAADAFPKVPVDTQTVEGETSWFYAYPPDEEYIFWMSRGLTTTDLGSYGGKWGAGGRDAYVMFQTGKKSTFEAIECSPRDFPGTQPPEAVFNGPSFGFDPYASLAAAMAAGETITLYSATSDDPVRMSLAHPAGVSEGPETPWADYDTTMRAYWRGELLDDTYFPRFYARYSALGLTPHVVYSSELVIGAGYGLTSFEGDMLTGEASTESPHYSFIGYI